MSFYDFLISNYSNAETPTGDLARDIENDPHFPRKADNWRDVKTYLDCIPIDKPTLHLAVGAFKEYAQLH